MVALVAALLLPEPDVQQIVLKISGMDRRAIVVGPSKKSKNPPLIFGFHGHGGNARNAQRRYDFYSYWPEAVCVFPEGIPTKTPNDPEGKRNGWQISPGQDDNRDLKFFDAIYAKVVKDYAVDASRVFCMGHSNGGRMTYLLWAERPKLFSAFAPAASAGRPFQLEPKPFFYVGSESDPIVAWRGQQATLDERLAVNGAEPKPIETEGFWSRYRAKIPCETFLHDQGHAFPSESIPRIVRFFRSVVEKPSATK